MAPSVSFWDCGEYIATSHILGIPHPPGNPFYVVLGRFFSIVLGFGDIPVAQRINIISVISAAFSALCMYLIIGRVIVATWGKPDTLQKRTILYVSGIVGAFFGVFNYTFWFSAVEASVYIPSVLTVLLNIYLALVWSQSKDPNRDKYLLLFAYIAFLGIGIHMMALFALLPVLGYVMLKDRNMRRDWRLWCIALILGSVAYDVSTFIVIAPFTFFIMLLFAYTPQLFAGIVGALISLILLLVKFGDLNAGSILAGFMGILPYLLLVALPVVSFIKQEPSEDAHRRWKFVFLVVLYSLLGYSIHAFIPIRSAMEPAINENKPVIEFGNMNRAEESYEEFQTALEEEAQVQKKYTEFIHSVENDSALSKSWGALHRSFRSSRTAPSQAYETFLARLENTPVAGYRQTFLDTLSTAPEIQSTYTRYIDAVAYDSSRSSINTYHDQFTQLLREDETGGVRQAYIAYIQEARENEKVAPAYIEFILSRTESNSAQLYADFMEQVQNHPTAGPLHTQFIAALEKSSSLSQRYEKFISAVKENSDDIPARYSRFTRALENEQGTVEEAYHDYLQTVQNDPELKRLRQSFMDDVKRDRVAEDEFKTYIQAVKNHSDARRAYENFRSALSQNPSIKKTYEEFVKNMGYISFRDMHWDDFRNFLERKQYGSESMLTRMFHRRGAVTRQFGIDGHMGYLGFHLTQFFHFGENIHRDRMGTAEDEHFRPGARQNNIILGDHGIKSFLALLIYLIPTILVLWGIFFWYTHNPSATLLLTILFFTTTIAFGLYMNFADGTRPDSRRDVEHYERQKEQWEQEVERVREYRNMAMQNPDMDLERADEIMQQLQDSEPEMPTVHREVRIRDYFYTAGFATFGLWIGLAVAGILFTAFNSPLPRIQSAAPIMAGLFLLTPLIPIGQNYEQSDRSNDWIPYDYAYNLLNSCTENAILFTGGDNDTFPLWFIQEAAGVRKDVRVVNFSLLNTKWYIRQMRDLKPRVPITYSDYDIDTLEPGINQYGRNLERGETPEPQFLEKAEISIMPPTFSQKQFLTTSNKMLLHIVDENRWEKPLYFTFGTRSGDLMGLEPYMETHGMVRRLKRTRGHSMNMERTEYLMDSVYQYRGILGEDTVAKSETAEKTIRHYVYMHYRFINELTGIADLQQSSHIVSQANRLLPMRENRLREFENMDDPQHQEFAKQLRSEINQIRQEKQRAQSKIAAIEGRIEKNADKALEYADRAIALLPSFPMSYVTKADILRHIDELQKAVETLETGIENCREGETGNLEQMLQQINSERERTDKVRDINRELEALPDPQIPQQGEGSPQNEPGAAEPEVMPIQ
jgi:tetratricopeptide (TPR) repeat protein